MSVESSVCYRVCYVTVESSVCYRVRYVSRELCMLQGPICQWRALYATGSDRSHACCTPCPLCHSSTCHSREVFIHRVLCVTVTLFLCTTPIVPQGLICPRFKITLLSRPRDMSCAIALGVGEGVGLGSRWKHGGPCTYRACDTPDRVTQRNPFVT